MDDRRERIERILAEIKRELAAGTSINSADWVRLHPDLQPELGERLAGLLGWPETIAAPSSGPDPRPVAPVVNPDTPTAQAGSSRDDEEEVVDPHASTALAPPTPRGTELTQEDRPGSGVSGRTIDMGGDPTVGQVDPNAETRSGPGTEDYDPHLTRADIDTSQGLLADFTTIRDPNLDRTAIDGGWSSGNRPAGTLEPGQKVRYIGDYELSVRIGVGGMGEVWRAKQISLNRLVAVKMIKNASFANDDQVRRFQNEAETVATLDHPGIVPIYEVGTFEDQRYFSMKLIDGKGMEKALPELKANPRETARIVAEVAEAVHHAHQRGVLHRDLKPANILLDVEKHAHVTDFGLAKRIEGEEGLTLPGTVLGTPAYMSPEQASGQLTAITTASDVYGIGAILFAALTDRAPFVANSIYVTLDRVRNDPPDAPHRLNPGVPRDLEVICLKCLEKDPRRRYGSALEVAEDLRRWLNNEPIKARPVGPFVRLGMWAKRKPALAGLSAALLVASIVGMVGIVWLWRVAVYERNQAHIARDDAIRQKEIALDAEGKAKVARDAAQASEKAAVTARAEAEKNANIASTQAAIALDTIQLVISKIIFGLEGRPELFGLRADIIELVKSRIDNVAKINQQSTSQEATTLSAMTDLGRIYRQTGQIERAVAMFQECLPLAKLRLIIRKRNSSSRYNLAIIYQQLAGCAEELDRDMNAVIANLKEALALEEDVLARPTDENKNLTPSTTRLMLADIHTDLGAAYHHLGEIGRAIDEFRRAYNLRGEVLAASKENPTVLRQFAVTELGTVEDPNATRARLIRQIAQSALAMADCSDRLGRREAAEDDFRQALEKIEEAAKVETNATFTKLSRGNYHTTIGNYRFRRGELEAARRHFETSHELFADLARADSKNVYFRRELLAATVRLAQLADIEKKPELARKEYDEAAKLADEIFRVDEKNDLRRIELMLVLPHVNQVDRALKFADTLAAGPKVDPELWTYLARTYAQCARALPPEKVEQAPLLQRKAVEAIEKAIGLGFRDRAVLDLEHDLNPLRNRDDFKAALSKVPPLG
jgi:tetratricopeptide (TPR) repeat protein